MASRKGGGIFYRLATEEVAAQGSWGLGTRRYVLRFGLVTFVGLALDLERQREKAVRACNFSLARSSAIVLFREKALPTRSLDDSSRGLASTQ